jgi:hypothetical protein
MSKTDSAYSSGRDESEEARKRKDERAIFNASRKLDSSLNENNTQGDQESEGEDHVERLSKAREEGTNRRGSFSEVKNAMKSAKKIAVGSRVAFSMVKEINFLLDMPFFAAFGAALLKDLFDLVDFATVILPFLFSMLCGIFIFMMLLLAGSAGKRNAAKKILNKVLIVLGGSIADGIPGLDLFPIETATVFIIYLMALRERAEDREIERTEA